MKGSKGEKRGNGWNGKTDWWETKWAEKQMKKNQSKTKGSVDLSQTTMV